MRRPWRQVCTPNLEEQLRQPLYQPIDLCAAAGADRQGDSIESAILALQEARARLLLVDLGLPDRSGLEIARIVRGWYGYPHIPIIALTGGQASRGSSPSRLCRGRSRRW